MNNGLLRFITGQRTLSVETDLPAGGARKPSPGGSAPRNAGFAPIIHAIYTLTVVSAGIKIKNKQCYILRCSITNPKHRRFNGICRCMSSRIDFEAERSKGLLTKAKGYSRYRLAAGCKHMKYCSICRGMASFDGCCFLLLRKGLTVRARRRSARTLEGTSLRRAGLRR